MIDRFFDLLWSRALGKSTRREFELYVRRLIHYLFVSELSATELSREIRLIGCKPVNLEKGQAFVSLTTFDLNIDLSSGDFVRLYNKNQLMVASAEVKRMRKSTLDLISVKRFQVQDSHVHFAMLDLRDVPIEVQRNSLEQILADRSSENYTRQNFRSIQGWSSRVWASACDLVSLGPRQIPEGKLFDKRLAGNKSMMRALALGCQNSK